MSNFFNYIFRPRRNGKSTELILMVLANRVDRPIPLSDKKISEMVGIRLGSAVKILNTLEKDGLVVGKWEYPIPVRRRRCRLYFISKYGKWKYHISGNA